MIILNLFEDDTIQELPSGYRDEDDDQSVLKLSDLRKTRLTLGQLNKLRILNDIRQLEREQDLKKISTQYRPAEQEQGGF